MTRDEVADLMRQLDEIVGPIEGDDPKVLKRVRILDAAEALFIRQGYVKTSMDEVAREAGVAKGTLYLYFNKKADLILAAIGREKRKYVSGLMDIFDEALPAEDRMRRWLVAVILAVTKMPLSGRIMAGGELTALMDDLPPAIKSQTDRNRDTFVVPMIEELVGNHTWTPAELRDRADVLISLGMLATVPAQPHLLRDMTPERYAELLADIVVTGLSRKDNDQ